MANSSNQNTSVLEILDDTIIISDDDSYASDSILIEALDAAQCRSSPLLDVTSMNTEFRILSWNIDGRDERELEMRALAVSRYIDMLSPHIVLLQEVVDENLKVLKNLCASYEFIHRKIDYYYNAMMIKKDANIRIKTKKWKEFPNSRMGRCLLYIEAEIFGSPFVILTSHLESLKDFSRTRKEQLNVCFDIITNYLSKFNVIFSGDMNIRDNELSDIGGKPEGIFDAWEVCGSNESARYTWDMKKNDNLSFPAFKPSARFDRMYFGSLGYNGIRCSNFQLVGTQRIDGCKLFPSDHFGILAEYSIAQCTSHIT